MAKKPKPKQASKVNTGPSGVWGELLEQGRYNIMRQKLHSGSDKERLDPGTKERLDRLTRLDSVEMSLAGMTLALIAVVYYLSV